MESGYMVSRSGANTTNGDSRGSAGGEDADWDARGDADGGGEADRLFPLSDAAG